MSNSILCELAVDRLLNRYMLLSMGASWTLWTVLPRLGR